MDFYGLVREHDEITAPYTNKKIEKAVEDIGVILNGFTVQDAAITLGLAQNHLWAAQVHQNQD